MKLDDLGSDTALLIVRGGSLLILAGVYGVTEGLLGLDPVFTVLAIVIAEVLWWQSDWVWELGTRRTREEHRAYAAMVQRSSSALVPGPEATRESPPSTPAVAKTGAKPFSADVVVR